MEEILTKATQKLNKQAKKLDKIVKETNKTQDEHLALNLARKRLSEIMTDLIHIQVKAEADMKVLDETIWPETEKLLLGLRCDLINIKVSIDKNFKYVDKDDLKNTLKTIESIHNHIENLLKKGKCNI